MHHILCLLMLVVDNKFEYHDVVGTTWDFANIFNIFGVEFKKGCKICFIILLLILQVGCRTSEKIELTKY